MLPNGFEERTVASGLSLPTAIAWAPDGRMFVAEKKGFVRVVDPDGTAKPLLDISSHVYGIADRGLLGIATDSDFANNHWLYLLYVYEPSPAPSDGRRTSRLTRVSVGDDNTVSDETVILGKDDTAPCPAPSNTLDCIPADSDSHAIGTVRSAPDGTLWLGSGDGVDWTRVDPRALRTYDERSFAGKIIHVDRDGMGIPGHAFCPEDQDLSHVCTKLYAKGLRNPFRFTLRNGTDPVVGDVGWEQYEELNLMRAPGRNYGWPCYEAWAHTAGYSELPECPAEYARESTPAADTLPDYDYPHADANFQGAIVAGPLYTGGPYPDDFDGSVFFGDYTGAYIKRLQLDVDGDANGVVAFATGAVPADLELGPGNELYYVDFGDGTPGTGSVQRIVYTPQNHTPLADATGSPAFGPSPLTVDLRGAGSSDPDGDPLTYDWDFGDGSPHSSERDPVHTYDGAGEFDARLTVSDDKGASATATAHVSVDNSPPTGTIESPLDGSEFLIRDTIVLSASATDAEDGELTGAALQWQVSLIHKTHTHDLTGLSGAQTSFAPAADHDADAHYRITLIATDAAGLSTTKRVEIFPRSVSLTLASSPPGAPVTYAGTSVPAPVTRTSAIDFVSSISAADSFVSENTTYDFVGWSDGGARAHEITIPSTDETLTALYEPQPSLDEEILWPTLDDGFAIPDAPSAQIPSPAATLRPRASWACRNARARRKQLRHRISRVKRDARRASRGLRASGEVDPVLRRRYRAEQRRLRRLQALLEHVMRDASLHCRLDAS
jgi:glucose/arabinose dehydrogenase